MKFGQHFWVRQILEWADAYVDYDDLKEQVRESGEKLPNLRGALVKIEDFSQQRHAEISKRIDAVLKQLKIERGSLSQPKELQNHLQQKEATECVAALEDIALSIADLDLFRKFNHDALRRIAAKAGQAPNQEEFIQTHEWTDELFTVNAALRSVAEARVPHMPWAEAGQEPQELGQRDFRGRSPLHYAAECGSPEQLARILATAEKKGTLYQHLWDHDDGNRTPMHIAIRRGDAEIVELLSRYMLDGSRGHSENTNHAEALARGGFLAIAIRLGCSAVARVLMQSANQLEYRGKHGETVLHVAVRAGQTETAAALLAAGIVIDVRETARGWTPLAAACVGGHTRIVEMLLQAGAELGHLDRRGWTAIEHAAYRGHTEIVETLRKRARALLNGEAKGTKKTAYARPLPPTVPTSCNRTRALTLQIDRRKCHIYACLGTFNVFSKEQAIDLAPLSKSLSPAMVPESNLWLEISATACDSPLDPYLYRLPVLGELTDDLWHFTTSAPDKATLVFRVYRAAEGGSRETALAATGFALLDSLRKGLGADRESLVRDYRVPLARTDGGYAGSLLFSFLVTRPFAFELDPSTPPQSMLPTAKTQIGGHRGLGQNNKREQHLQIGENTIESFSSAFKLGAAFVEFDVQVTKDFVPVVYHDFLVNETGTEAAMHSMSYAQFMAISDAQSGFQQAPGPERLLWDERARPTVRQTKRSRSVCASADTATKSLHDRMRHSTAPGFVKANTRGNHIHEPFTTLREMFERLPEAIAFDVEIKYPMLYEAEDFKMDSLAMELNKFIDAILAVVYQNAGRRPLFFTSFSPEACIMLVTKQKTYPVLFLNDSSNWPTGDSRALSVQTAVRFAERWGLQGIVMASEPWVAAPRLVHFVKQRGLYTSSYGALNDDPESVKIQVDAGLDSVIVNDVQKMVRLFVTGDN